MRPLILTVFLLQIILMVKPFTVDILNITDCASSKGEKGSLLLDLGAEETVDPLLSGVFNLPKNLDEKAIVEYQSHVWDHGEWNYLFQGNRSFCNSIVPTIAYDQFRKIVQPHWPDQCDVPADAYEFVAFPVSGQYVVLSNIRNVAPLCKHEVKLMVGKDLILCRVVYTISNY